MSEEGRSFSVEDRRRAAALIVHWQRDDLDGFNAILGDLDGPDDATFLLVGVLTIYSDLLPELRTRPAISFLTQHVLACAGLAGDEGDTGDGGRDARDAGTGGGRPGAGGGAGGGGARGDAGRERPGGDNDDGHGDGEGTDDGRWSR